MRPVEPRPGQPIDRRDAGRIGFDEMVIRRDVWPCPLDAPQFLALRDRVVEFEHFDRFQQAGLRKAKESILAPMMTYCSTPSGHCALERLLRTARPHARAHVGGHAGSPHDLEKKPLQRTELQRQAQETPAQNPCERISESRCWMLHVPSAQGIPNPQSTRCLPVATDARTCHAFALFFEGRTADQGLARDLSG